MAEYFRVLFSDHDGPYVLAFLVVLAIGFLLTVVPDASLVFDRQLIKKYIKRFSLRSLFGLSTITAIAFAITGASELGLVESVIIAGFATSLFVLISIAMRDVSEPIVQRRYRKKLRLPAHANAPRKSVGPLPKIETGATPPPSRRSESDS